MKYRIDFTKNGAAERKTMVKLASESPYFQFERELQFINHGRLTLGEPEFQVLSDYMNGRKGKYKRVMREIRGQLMQITDRREQYYAKRQSHDDSANLQAERKFRFPKRPKPFISEHERMMQD